MDWLNAILSGLEAPFPIAFVLILAIALYILGNNIKSKSDDPKESTPSTAKYKITKNNAMIGMAASVLWMAGSYFTSFGFEFFPCALQYLLVGIIAGITASGFSTMIYEILKNKLKLEQSKTIKNNKETSGDEKITALKNIDVEEKINELCNTDDDFSDK